MDKANIREKIKNLLDLAKSSNPHESMAAMKKAQELMLKYNIELSEEELNPEDTSTVKTTFTQFTKLKLQRHHLILAAIIAKNFRCKTYYSGTRVHFMGISEDSVAAMNIYSFLVEHLEQMFKVFLKDDKKLNPCKYAGQGQSFSKAVKRNWIEGYENGLARVFEEQVKADERYQLMVVVPNAVMVQYKELHTRPSTMKGHVGADIRDNDAWRNGYETGKNAMNNRSLKGDPLGIEG